MILVKDKARLQNIISKNCKHVHETLLTSFQLTGNAIDKKISNLAIFSSKSDSSVRSNIKKECNICSTNKTSKNDKNNRVARYSNQCNSCENYYCMTHGKKINEKRTCNVCA